MKNHCLHPGTQLWEADWYISRITGISVRQSRVGTVASRPRAGYYSWARIGSAGQALAERDGLRQ
jgi:hypothetical protein